MLEFKVRGENSSPRLFDTRLRLDREVPSGTDSGKLTRADAGARNGRRTAWRGAVRLLFPEEVLVMFTRACLAVSIGSLALLLVTGAALPDDQNRSWAIKMFADPKFDFGPVAQHSDCQSELEFTNVFEPDMEVVSVSTSCKCITATTETKLLKPHQKGKIKLVLDTSRFQGQRHVTLTVQFKYGGSNYVTASIPCAAFIRTDVWMQPGFANLGSLTTGVGGEQKVKITRTGNDQWQIRQIRSRNPGLTTELKELTRGNGRVEYEILVKVAPDAQIGHLQESLVLVTNDSSNANVALRVEGRVEADILVTPDVLPLGNLKPGQEVRFPVIVRSKKPVRIERIELSEHPDSIKISVPSEEKTTHMLFVVVTPPDQMGVFHETISVVIAGRAQPLVFTANGKVESLATAQGTK